MMPAVSIAAYIAAALLTFVALGEYGEEGIGRGAARRRAKFLGAFALVLLFGGAIIQDASAAKPLTMTMQEARQAAATNARQSLASFTEKKPAIRVSCERKDAATARCSIRYRGDRLHARMAATVRLVADTADEQIHDIRMGRLTLIKPKPKVRWNRALASWYQLTGSSLGCPPYRGMDTVTLGVAHKTLACGTRVRFSYAGRSVTAIVNDRGPYVGGREFDLSGAVRAALGFPDGVATVLWRLP